MQVPSYNWLIHTLNYAFEQKNWGTLTTVLWYLLCTGLSHKEGCKTLMNTNLKYSKWYLSSEMCFYQISLSVPSTIFALRLFLITLTCSLKVNGSNRHSCSKMFSKSTFQFVKQSLAFILDSVLHATRVSIVPRSFLFVRFQHVWRDEHLEISLSFSRNFQKLIWWQMQTNSLFLQHSSHCTGLWWRH